MANRCYGMLGFYVAAGALNLRESAVTSPVGIGSPAFDVRAMLLSSTTTAGPEGINNGGTNSEDIQLVSSFTTLGEYNHVSTYVPGDAASQPANNQGRKSLASQAISFNSAKDRTEWTFAALTWTALGPTSVGTGAKGLLIFLRLGADSVNVPLIWIDTVAVGSGTAFPFQGSGGDAVLNVGASGLLWIGDRNLMSLVP